MRVPGVFVAGDATTAFAVDRPAPPPERVAAEGRFKAELLAARRGAVAAPVRSAVQLAPERFQEDLKRQRLLRHPPRGPEPESGDVSDAPRSLDLDAVMRATSSASGGPPRVRTLGLFVGGGGSRCGMDDPLLVGIPRTGQNVYFLPKFRDRQTTL